MRARNVARPRIHADRRFDLKAHAPSRNTALIALILFVLGVIGVFVPLGHIHYVGEFLHVVNRIAVYLLIGGYGLLLAAVYIL